MSNVEKPLSILDLADMKRCGTKIACLTAYDATFAALLDRAGVDVMLVGDSLGMVIQGHPSTLPVTVDQMVYHTGCVTRARRRAFVIADLPFMSYASPAVAAENAARLMREGGAQMVKLEGGRNRRDAIAHMVAQGIPVCGHLGLQPQSINQLGRYRVQGRDEATAAVMQEDAQILEDAGASMLVLECVPAALAQSISGALTIPVIGIGAGSQCDGQVLVLYDILGIGSGRRPRFCKNFMDKEGSIAGAVQRFVEEVRGARFPDEEHQY